MAYENRILFENDKGIKLPYSYFNVNEYKFPYFNAPVIDGLDKIVNKTINIVKRNINVIHKMINIEVYLFVRF